MGNEKKFTFHGANQNKKKLQEKNKIRPYYWAINLFTLLILKAYFVRQAKSGE
jgi:hypothetical protein